MAVLTLNAPATGCAPRLGLAPGRLSRRAAGHRGQTVFRGVGELSLAPCQTRPVARRIGSARASVAVTEKATGVAFPQTFTPPGLTTELSLLGAGVREKSFAIIAVKVYAVGLYLDLAQTPTPWKGKPAEELQKDRAFFDSLAEAPSDKALILTLVRNVSAEQFVNALSEELAPKLTAQGADVAVISQLSAFFQGRALKKDSAVLLAWQQPSKLNVSFVENVKAGYGNATTPLTVDSRPLLKALFDLYLGSDPISPSLVSSLAAGAASL